MTPLRFRAWEQEDKDMFYSYDGCDFGYLRSPKSGRGGVVSYFLSKKFPVMQSTGLTDKNGKELFEGDVMQGEYGEQSKEPLEKIVGQVRFESGSFIIVFPFRRKYLHAIDGNHAIYWRDQGNHLVGAEWFYRIERIQVIGNIYENPDLLPA